MSESDTIHLAADLSFLHTDYLWRLPGSWVGYPYYGTAEFYEDIARTARRGVMDMLFFGDSGGTPDDFGGNHHAVVRLGAKWPKHDMTPMIPLMARAASGVGFALTMSTTYHLPFYCARLFNALDHVTNGRIAWNAVTSAYKNEAANYGFEEMMEHDERYDRAHEFLQVACALWDSVEPDVLVFDREHGIFADPEKVHRLDFHGRWFDCRGPLPVLPSPQGRPVIIQAGLSEPGMTLAATYADLQFSTRRTLASMKEHRAALDAKLAAVGRVPRDVGILWSIRIQVADSDAAAQEMERRYLEAIPPQAGLLEMSAQYGVDFSKARPDMRLSDFAEEVAAQKGNLGSFAELLKTVDPDQTVEAFGRRFLTDRILVAAGTPKTIADRLEALHFETGANGGFILGKGFLDRQHRRVRRSCRARAAAPRPVEDGLCRPDAPGKPQRMNRAPSMIVERNIAVPVGDGTVLRANLFRPPGEGRHPVIMALGIYGKDVHFADAYEAQWTVLKALNPEIDTDGSSGRYLRWETVDPERWVPHGYAVITVDGRGSGQSPGYLDPFSPRETQDFYDAIEWAAARSWSNGKVGLIGISYLAIKQWQVAALRPPHLAAIVPWEGASDIYREWSHQGGIFGNTFPTAWIPRQVLVTQHGNAETPHRDRETGERTTGPALPPAMLQGNRAAHHEDLLDHPLDDAWYGARTPDLGRIEVPLFSAGNWGGLGLHLRGNIEGYLRAGSARKWLSIHIGTHFESFYAPDGIARQRKFLDRFLKGVDNGWENEPRVRLAIRRTDGAAVRAENEWPLARTQWTKLYLCAAEGRLAAARPEAPGRADYEADGPGADFATAPFEAETEFTGPVMTRLWISSSTSGMDIFATLRAIDPAGRNIVFVGASEPVPVSRGWLRASHRKLDPAMSRPYRPYHRHTEIEKLEPGAVYEVEVEIWPTSIVFPSGYRLMLTLQGRDFEFPGVPGRMLHTHPQDRPAGEFGGTNTILTGGAHGSYLLMPRIPGP